ncbi:MAG: KEOPS complex kinase/ATPase Bud32 [Nanoarchaeota archaeon]|nr:KEOPS complex kinase/ATPase Bud32 [Nanoarchaeota archaeon]
MKSEIIQRGAEALIVREGDLVVKHRVKKSYRLSDLDEMIRKLRTRSEAKLLEKASKVIDVPLVKDVDESEKTISMELISGKKLSDNFDSFSLEERGEIALVLGRNISRLHDADIIHGDLTTSNLILAEGGNEDKSVGGFRVFFIDFGLGFISKKIEDKAVDLHLLKQALEAKHFENWEVLFSKVLEGYSLSENSESVLKQLEKVEKRGRYKDKY